MNEDERPTDRRRIYHHFTFYGFLLCFASTTVATLYHYLIAREAPYPWYDLPVVLGTLGGIGLLIGPAGLLGGKMEARSGAGRQARIGMDVAFIVMLFLTSLTGMALLVCGARRLRWDRCWRCISAWCFRLFITMPYGKFVHGIYRFVALVRYARERRMMGHV